MRFINYILAIATATVFLASCEKEGGHQYGAIDKQMSFMPMVESSRTKAMIDKSDLKSAEYAGSQVVVYDFYTPASSETAYKWVDNNTITAPGGTQIWTSENRYAWTLQGKHQAFGWLAKDAKDNLTWSSISSNPLVFDDAARVLSVPEVSFTQDTPQYDFLYSAISTRVLPGTDDNDYSPMMLNLRHLFSAFSIGVKNVTSKITIDVKSITIQGLHNTKSATVYFDDSGNPVAYSNGTNTASFSYKGSGFSLSPNQAVADVLAADGNVTIKSSSSVTDDDYEYFMIWPQTENEMIPQNKYDIDAEGVYQDNTTDPLIIVEYVSHSDAGTSALVKRAIPFPITTNKEGVITNGKEWKAGYRHHFDLVFADKQIQLVAVVNPWQYEDEEIDFADKTVAVKDGWQLTPVMDTYTRDSEDFYKLYFNGGLGIAFTFGLDTPEGATWMVSLEGHWNRFSVSPSSGIIDSSEPVTFTITPISEEADQDYSARLRFNVRLGSGEVVSADILQTVNGDYKPYTVVQQKNM